MPLLSQSIRNRLKYILRRLGYEVAKYDALNAPLARRFQLLRHHDISLILDVGANIGQYALLMRKYGFRGKIISFEPLAHAFDVLQQKAARDPKWDVLEIGLGDREEVLELNITENDEWSSFLGFDPASSEVRRIVDRQPVQVKMLDSLYQTLCAPEDRVYLKMDAQGYEQRILDGASASLRHIVGVQTELSLQPVYQNGSMLTEVLPFMTERGFCLASFEPTNVCGTSGRLLQVDCIFYRDERNR